MPGETRFFASLLVDRSEFSQRFCYVLRPVAPVISRPGLATVRAPSVRRGQSHRQRETSACTYFLLVYLYQMIWHVISTNDMIISQLRYPAGIASTWTIMVFSCIQVCDWVLHGCAGHGVCAVPSCTRTQDHLQSRRTECRRVRLTHNIDETCRSFVHHAAFLLKSNAFACLKLISGLYMRDVRKMYLPTGLL
jgi:hypothetical protein